MVRITPIGLAQILVDEVEYWCDVHGDGLNCLEAHQDFDTISDMVCNYLSKEYCDVVESLSEEEWKELARHYEEYMERLIMKRYKALYGDTED